MSESRQHFTGSIFKSLFFWIVSGVFCWFFPDLLVVIFPQWSVQSIQPWLLNPNDLTWTRSLMIVLSKPGFRVVIALCLVSIFLLLKEFIFGLKTKHFSFGHLRQSTEWVMDGGRTVPLMEYARWVGVI